MKSFLSISSGVLFALTLANSLPAHAQTSTAEVWQVEISAFSGRENPVLTLEPAEVAEVRARLKRVSVVRSTTDAEETLLPARLGYRGMVIRGSTGGKPLEHTEVSENKVLRKVDGTLNDGKTAALESYLLSLAVSKGTISQDLAKIIKSQSRGAIP